MPQIDQTVETITVAAAAELLGCDRRTVHRLVERGALEPVLKLPGLRGALVLDRAAVEALAEERAA